MRDSNLDVILGSIDLIPVGEGRNFDVEGEGVAVFHSRSGQVFAVQAACPHKRGPLADGLVGGTTVICPLHSWKFDLSSGEPLVGACRLRTYPVRLDEERRVILTVPVSEVQGV